MRNSPNARQNQRLENAYDFRRSYDTSSRYPLTQFVAGRVAECASLDYRLEILFTLNTQNQAPRTSIMSFSTPSEARPARAHRSWRTARRVPARGGPAPGCHMRTRTQASSHTHIGVRPHPRASEPHDSPRRPTSNSHSRSNSSLQYVWEARERKEASSLLPVVAAYSTLNMPFSTIAWNVA